MMLCTNRTLSLMGRKRKRISACHDAVATSKATERGLELAVENGWRGGICCIEGDFRHAVEAMAGRLRFRSKKEKEQYTEIAAMLPRLGKTTVSHVLRKGNKVADCFAELGHKVAEQRVWRDVPPKEGRLYSSLSETPKGNSACEGER